MEKKRQCLKCDKYFKSRDAGNRICDKCTAVNKKVYMYGKGTSSSNRRAGKSFGNGN